MKRKDEDDKTLAHFEQAVKMDEISSVQVQYKTQELQSKRMKQNGNFLYCSVIVGSPAVPHTIPSPHWLKRQVVTCSRRHKTLRIETIESMVSVQYVVRRGRRRRRCVLLVHIWTQDNSHIASLYLIDDDEEDNHLFL